MVAACLADAIGAFGVASSGYHLRRRVLTGLLRLPVRRVAERLLAYDAIVADQGLQRGGAYALPTLARHAVVHGQANIPRRGPLLLVSNHPGLADAAALFAHVPRVDLRVIAARRPLLAALPATARQLLFVPEDGSNRLPVVRQAARHMRHGGALLTFPAGRIEPDPAIRSDAIAALAQWSPCVDSFARLAPDLTIVPVVVSGVLSRRALDHPVTRLRHAQRDREWLAATLQMLVPALADVTVRVVFGAPIRVSTLAVGQSARAAVLDRTRQLMRDCALPDQP
ncbi:1-acyl-sn-glycerol-3-phosphate acyltransferase [Salinisphaera aquimarina]|uniref:1-acyl-sn-glycerol-3-phosphate acyltransferase n=1 Tax=Salinisphaera aquimarina TaxID=2094031 RepID=A0ABV7EQM2_9GAMM